MTNLDFYTQLAYRDADDHPFDCDGNMLPLEQDPEFLWTTEPTDVTYIDTHVYSLSYARGRGR